MSLCNQILDLNDDVNKAILTAIVKEGNVPELMKKASVVGRDERAKLSRHDFALVALTKEGRELRKYPINDAVNTWISARYFEKTAHKLPVRAQEIAASMLKKACALYHVEETAKLKGFESKVSSNLYQELQDMCKTAQRTEVEVSTPDNSKHFYALRGSYAMPNPEYVKKASAYFSDYESSFRDAADRHEFAKNVLERAKELDVALDNKDSLEKYANADYGDILDVQIRMRQELLQTRPEMSAALEKVAEYKNTLTAPEFAKLLYAFDKKASLDKYYGGYLADSFKATFEQRLTKKASGYTWESRDGELKLTEKELTTALEKKAEKIKGYFGPTIADQLKKHGCSIFESLPDDAKETIAKIAKGKI